MIFIKYITIVQIICNKILRKYRILIGLTFLTYVFLLSLPVKPSDTVLEMNYLMTWSWVMTHGSAPGQAQAWLCININRKWED